MSDAKDDADPYGNGDGRYQAAGGNKRNPCLLIVPLRSYRQKERLLPFADIRRIENDMDGRQIDIDFSDVTVRVEGRYLRGVGRAIGAHTVSCIQAFEPGASYDPMPKDGDPVITSITYWTQMDELRMKRPGADAKDKPKHEPETQARAAESQP